MAPPDSSAKVTGVDSNAIYYEVSPTIICVMRLYNVLALLMVLVSFVICLVEGHGHESYDSAYYLLACNLVLSGMIAIVMNWWYRKSELSSDKYWVIFLIATFIIVQCITTDIYAVKGPPIPGGKVTVRPTHHTFSTVPYTGTTMTWLPINMSTITPPTLYQNHLEHPL